MQVSVWTDRRSASKWASYYANAPHSEVPLCRAVLGRLDAVYLTAGCSCAHTHTPTASSSYSSLQLAGMERWTHTGIKWVNSSNKTVWDILCCAWKGEWQTVHMCLYRGQRRCVISDYWVTHARTHMHTSLAPLFTHEPQSPCVSKLEVGYLYSQRLRAFLTHHWAIATLYSAENPVPALSISGPAAK